MEHKYAKLLSHLYSKYSKNKYFEAIRLYPEFYFEKARQALSQLAAFQADAHFYIDFLERYQFFSGDYLAFVQQLAPQPALVEFATLLGKAIAYLDKNAANKQTWNGYADKRTLALARLRQDLWVKYLVQYLQNERQIERVGNAKVRYALQYLQTPDQHFPILSPHHRSQISEHLLEKTYDEAQFEASLLQYFEPFSLQIHQRDNKTHWIASFLYTPEVAQIWQYDETESLTQLPLEYDLVAEPELAYGRAADNTALNQIFYGVPGTGKTHYSRLWALAIAEQTTVEWLHTLSPIDLQARWQQHHQAGHIALVTFHPSLSYEDFIEGIKPKTHKNTVVYELEDGLLKQMAKAAAEKPEQPFVLIIDEINRGNVAQIFGELLTLLESDKRQGARHALQVRLPYSKEPFSLPANLHLIGTMNTTDRHAENLDAALRRRFRFRAFRPQPELLAKDVEGIDIQQLLTVINQRVSYLLDEEHCIGHAYLLPVQTLEQLQEVFEYQLIPLLLDYLYNDLGKLGAVLGTGFVEVLQPPAYPLSDFPYEGNVLEKTPYRLRAFPIDKEAFVAVYRS